jgi:hypothetical protein
MHFAAADLQIDTTEDFLAVHGGVEAGDDKLFG